MIKIILLLLVLLGSFMRMVNAQPADGKSNINLIPKPVKTEIRTSDFIINGETSIIVCNVDTETFKIATDFTKKINKSKHFNIQAVQKDDTTELNNQIRFCFSADSKKYGLEGYSLDVTSRGIIIEANKANGFFYAVQTIYQLLPNQIFSIDAIGSINLKIPSVYIFDHPRFGWRGNMLDPSRHFISVDFIKKNLDYLASLKMNIFHWHLTDDQGWRIEINSLPKLTEIGAWRVDRNNEEWWGRKPHQPGEKATYGGFYSQEEIKEIVQYAKERYITIIPEIDIPGHSQAAIASYPEISCDGRTYFVATGGVAKDNTYCPGKEITFEFTEKVLREVMNLFPSEYIHIGGDECNKEAWEVCSDCQKRIKNENLKDEHELQSYFITRIEKIINAASKKMIGWDEILEGGLAPNATVMSWRGEEGGIAALKAGHDVIMTPNQYCYLDLKQGDPEIEPNYGYSQLLLTTVYSYNPIPKDLSEMEAKHILGIQGNLWGESMQTVFDLNYMLFPRLFAIAEVAWSPQESRDFDDFMPRLEFALKRLEFMGVNYAKSVYNVSVFTSIDENVNGILVNLSTEINSNIRYTTDGREPDINSKEYVEPFKILETTIVKAKLYRDNYPLGVVTEKTIQIHKATGKKADILSQVQDKYNCGEYGLTDCLRGGNDFANKKWMGFEGIDFEAVIDMEETTVLKSVTTSFLHDTKPWIFLPENIEISVSENGKDFSVIGTFDNSEEVTKNGKYVKEFSTEARNVSARYIKVKAKNIGLCPDWHQGAGGKAWLFIDEIIVN